MTYFLDHQTKAEIASELADEKTREDFHISLTDYQLLQDAAAVSMTFDIFDYMCILFLECLSSDKYDVNDVVTAFLMASYECGRGAKINDSGDDLELRKKLTEQENIQQLKSILITPSTRICVSGHMNKLCEKLACFSDKIHFLAVTDTYLYYQIQQLFFTHIKETIESLKRTDSNQADELMILIDIGKPTTYFLEKFDAYKTTIKEKMATGISLSADKNLAVGNSSPLGKALVSFCSIISETESISNKEGDLIAESTTANSKEITKLLNNYYPQWFVQYIRGRHEKTPSSTTSCSSSSENESSNSTGKRKLCFFGSKSPNQSSYCDGEETKEGMQVVDDDSSEEPVTKASRKEPSKY